MPALCGCPFYLHFVSGIALLVGICHSVASIPAIVTAKGSEEKQVLLPQQQELFPECSPQIFSLTANSSFAAKQGSQSCEQREPQTSHQLLLSTGSYASSFSSENKEYFLSVPLVLQAQVSQTLQSRLPAALLTVLNSLAQAKEAMRGHCAAQ